MKVVNIPCYAFFKSKCFPSKDNQAHDDIDLLLFPD